MTPPLITSRQLSLELAVSHQVICRWTKKGKIPAIRMPDGSYRFRRADIDQWLTARTTK